MPNSNWFEAVSQCPVCGDYMDYCVGHGEIGDPEGFAILQRHDSGDHSDCCIRECLEMNTTE